MLLGCIGDDFTGSSDLANTLAKGGVQVALFSGVPDGPSDAEAGVGALKSHHRAKGGGCPVARGA